MLGDNGIKVNLITVSTPAYNTDGQDALGGGLDSEDPRGSSGINEHVQIVHENDGVVTIAGGEQTFDNSTTDNRVITNDEIQLSGSIESHVQLPSHPDFEQVLQTVPSMTPAPKPEILDRTSSNP